MLSVGVAVDAALEHDPSVKINIGAFHGNSKFQGEVILVRLVQCVDGVAGPLIVQGHLAGDHVCLAGVSLKGINIVLHILEVFLHPGDHLRRSVIHLLLEPERVVRAADKLFGGEQI